eukprot:sb/3470045/
MGDSVSKAWNRALAVLDGDMVNVLFVDYAVVSYGEGPDEFFVNLVDADNKLDQLQARMQQVYGKGGTGVPRVFRGFLGEFISTGIWYMYVAVKFVEDEEVYRAKTITNDSDNPEVLYVDYGNSEVVPRDNVYQLENYLAKVLPCQAIRCALDNVDSIKDDMGEIKQELVDKFAELICEKVRGFDCFTSEGEGMSFYPPPRTRSYVVLCQSHRVP